MSEVAIYEPTTAITLRPARDLRPALQRVAFWATFAFIVSVALVAGLIVRRWAWDQTEPIRFDMDLNNAFRQGSAALLVGSTGRDLDGGAGYIDRYDERTNELANGERTGGLDLDYAPGRLAVATLWAKWVREQPVWKGAVIPRMPAWQQDYFFYRRARIIGQQYQLCEPLLMLNLTGELLSAIAMFFIVRRYTIGRAPNLRPTRGIILGLVAALFFWFDPALIFNAHCWPQWDSWVLPFFLWAILLASLNCWFCAGCVIAVGSMFKGQLLFGAPLLILWPLFQWRLPALARWVAGLMTGTAAVTAVWLVRAPGTMNAAKVFIPGHTDPRAIEWIIYMVLIFAAMASLLLQDRKSRLRVPVGIVVAAAITWIIGGMTNHQFSIIGFVVLAIAGWVVDDQYPRWIWQIRLALGLLAVAVLLYPLYELARDWMAPVLIATAAMGTLLTIAPRRAVPYAAAGWVAAAMLMCSPMFNTSRGWFDLGIAYGTHHYEQTPSRGDPNNLADLLEQDWHWTDPMEPVVALPAGKISDAIAAFLVKVDPGVSADRLYGRAYVRSKSMDIDIISRVPYQPTEGLKVKDGQVGLPLKYALLSGWIISVILCSIGAAMHDATRSPRFLAAISAPWILFFSLMMQMHQRYLLWGGSLSSASAVLSPGYALLHLFLSFVAMSQEMRSTMENNRYGANQFCQIIRDSHPGIAWAVLLCAAIYLYTSLRGFGGMVARFVTRVFRLVFDRVERI